MKTVREMMREYREAHGMTQRFVERRIGANLGRISALETGVVRLTADEFLDICVRGFGISPQIFFAEQFPEKGNNVG